MTRYDSIDAEPDKKGRVRPKMRKPNSSTLNSLRPNLFNGGIFFIGKYDYSKAYTLLDQYVSAAEMPIFKSYNYTAKDKNLPKAAYWAAYCGYKLNDAQKVLHNTYLALKDKEHYESMLQYLAATYMLENDTARSIATMEEGFAKYPKSEYFFSHLMDYYSQKPIGTKPRHSPTRPLRQTAPITWHGLQKAPSSSIPATMKTASAFPSLSCKRQYH